MQLTERLEILQTLRKIIVERGQRLTAMIQKAHLHNRWFAPENINNALDAIADKFLDERQLKSWTERYDLKRHEPKTVGLVMAGNIPLVGFHDFLCTFLSGNKAMMKLSGKDGLLLPFLLEFVVEKHPEFKNYFEFVERLKNFDAVIATGSNNSARYFEYYFGKYPNIIRKNRNSVAILQGDENEEEFVLLGRDLFSYYGLGCRNVSKIYLPKSFDPPKILTGLESFGFMADHHLYKSNLDYNLAIYLLNKEKIYSNNFVVLKQAEALSSPIAVIHYEFYSDEMALRRHLASQSEQIQCVVGNVSVGNGTIPFGGSQQPELWDYADKVDTMAFLSSLK